MVKTVEQGIVSAVNEFGKLEFHWSSGPSFTFQLGEAGWYGGKNVTTQSWIQILPLPLTTSYIILDKLLNF